MAFSRPRSISANRGRLEPRSLGGTPCKPVPRPPFKPTGEVQGQRKLWVDYGTVWPVPPSTKRCREGQLPDDLNLADISDVMFGAVYHRLLLRNGPLNEAYAYFVVDTKRELGCTLRYRNSAAGEVPEVWRDGATGR